MMDRDGRHKGPPLRILTALAPTILRSLLLHVSETLLLLRVCCVHAFFKGLSISSEDSVCLVRVYTGDLVKSNVKVFFPRPLTFVRWRVASAPGERLY